MDALGLAIVAAAFVAYAAISRSIETWPVTPALLFVAFGLLISPMALGIVHLDVGHSAIHMIAEFTLIILLFSDAAQIDRQTFLKNALLPRRLLSIALPLTIILGAIVAKLVFPSFSVFDIMLLAAILAPTDAALGQAVVTNPAVPEKIREALSVESGLNDGIVLPIVIFFATCASAAGHVGTGVWEWLFFGAKQVVLGPLAGIVIGYVGARVIDAAAKRGTIHPAAEGFAIIALALLAYAAAEIIGGNGFISAFVAGLTFGNAVRERCKFLFEFMEAEGQGLLLLTFLIFGAVMLGEAMPHFTPAILLYAILSLTLIRLLPVWLSLRGAGVGSAETVFIGWFGPRGLASILFALLIVERSDIQNADMILTVVTATVALSTLLHGLSASPAAAALSRLQIQRKGKNA